MWLKNTPNCTAYHGHVRFELPKEVRVGEELLTAPQIFINIGRVRSLDASAGIKLALWHHKVGDKGAPLLVPVK